MSQPSTQRPPQVTLAGSVVMFASVIVVLTVWESIRTLRSLERRESIERFLAEPLGSGLGLDVENVISLLHVSGLVAGACAAATTVLGWFVMRRDKGARVALGVLAVPLFVTGLFVGVLASSFVAAAAAMLWLSPAREWFATGQWTPPPSRESRAAEQQRRPTWPPMPPGPGQLPGAPPQTPPHASPQAPPHASPQAPPYGPPPGSAPYAGPSLAPYGVGAQHHAQPWALRPERPRALITAVILTIVPSVFVALFALMALAVAATGMEPFMEQLQRQEPSIAGDYSLGQWRSAILSFGVVGLVLSVLALTFACFVTAGREWARRGLMVTAAFCAGACLLMALAAPLVLVVAGAALVTLTLLNRPESRAWCRRDAPPQQSWGGPPQQS